MVATMEILEAQVKRYHASLIGNGNFSDYSQPCMQKIYGKASKAAGYRLVLEGGDISPVINPAQSFFIKLQWKNIGIAPSYEKWDVFFELKDTANNIVWSGIISIHTNIILYPNLILQV
jgi:hypothetical protein